MKESTQDGLIPAERQEYIISLVRQNRTVRVSTLSEALGVSEITIRRDLEKLEELGVLERSHGGAILVHNMSQEPLFVQKEQIQLEAKRAIGIEAARLVKEGETVFINSGSTTKQIFSHLTSISGLRVVTSNAAAISELHNSEKSIELIMVGGIYRWQSNSILGAFALSTISHINADKTFIGVDGISVQRGLTTPIHDEAEIATAMIEQTHGPIIVVADHSKMGVVAAFMVSSLDRVETIITDASLDAEWRESLEEQGVRVIIAGAAKAELAG